MDFGSLADALRECLFPFRSGFQSTSKSPAVNKCAVSKKSCCEKRFEIQDGCQEMAVKVS